MGSCQYRSTCLVLDQLGKDSLRNNLWQDDQLCGSLTRVLLWSKLLCENKPSLPMSNIDLSIYQDLFDSSQTYIV